MQQSTKKTIKDAQAEHRLKTYAPDLLAEVERQIKWLRFIRPQVKSSLSPWFYQAEASLNSVLKKVNGI